MNKETIKRILSSLILIPILFFFVIKGSFFFVIFLSMCFLITIYEWSKMSKKKEYFYPGFFFLIFSFYATYMLRNDGESNSSIMFLTVTLTCISTDIGGYIFGKLFKGPKLTAISPNKTYAGMIGGYILSIICFNIFTNYSYLFEVGLVDFTPNIFIFVLIISTVSQLGDLTVSYFKRLSKIKNTGTLIPGHGGLLDRIDGMIFAFPFAYIISIILK